MQLKSGIRPPLLSDVLQSAQAIAPHAKLIIEIKPGNSEAGFALSRLFTKHPDLMLSVAVIMSFDAFIVHSLRRDLTERFGPARIPAATGNDELSTSPMMYAIGGYTNEVARSYKEPSHLSTRKEMVAAETTHTYGGITIPKIMLVTVAEPPQQKCELWADVDDLSKIEGWLRHENESLDGVYLQFQPKMLHPEGATALKAFARKYRVGIWGLLGRDPDDFVTMQTLVRECNIDYYNTDLPRNFFKTKRKLTPPLLDEQHH